MTVVATVGLGGRGTDERELRVGGGERLGRFQLAAADRKARRPLLEGCEEDDPMTRLLQLLLFGFSDFDGGLQKDVVAVVGLLLG